MRPLAIGAPYMLYVQGKSSQDSLTFSEIPGDVQLPAVPKNAIALPGT